MCIFEYPPVVFRGHFAQGKDIGLEQTAEYLVPYDGVFWVEEIVAQSRK